MQCTAASSHNVTRDQTASSPPVAVRGGGNSAKYYSADMAEAYPFRDGTTNDVLET